MASPSVNEKKHSKRTNIVFTAGGVLEALEAVLVCQTNTGVDFVIYCDFVHRNYVIFCWLLRLTWHHVKTNEDKKWYKNSDHDQHASSFICNCYPPSKICTSLNLPNHPNKSSAKCRTTNLKVPWDPSDEPNRFSKLRGEKHRKLQALVSKEPVLRSLKKGYNMSKGKVLQGKIC